MTFSKRDLELGLDPKECGRSALKFYKKALEKEIQVKAVLDDFCVLYDGGCDVGKELGKAYAEYNSACNVVNIYARLALDCFISGGVL